MSREEYWNGDVSAVYDYIEADRHRRERDNERAWVQGMYNYAALGVIISNLFAKKGAKTPEYPSEPYKIYLSPREIEEENKKREEAEAAVARLMLDALVNNYQSIGKERENG